MRAGTAVHAVLEIERVHPVDADQQHPLNAFVVVVIARVGWRGQERRERKHHDGQVVFFKQGEPSSVSRISTPPLQSYDAMMNSRCQCAGASEWLRHCPKVWPVCQSTGQSFPTNLTLSSNFLHDSTW